MGSTCLKTEILICRRTSVTHSIVQQVWRDDDLLDDSDKAKTASSTSVGDLSENYHVYIAKGTYLTKRYFSKCEHLPEDSNSDISQEIYQTVESAGELTCWII